MAIKDEYVNLIVTQDLDIIAHIDAIKSEIFRELKAVSSSKKMLTGYKSEL